MQTATWMTRDGKHTMEATAEGFGHMSVRMDGREMGSGHLLTAQRDIPDMLYNQGARGIIQGGSLTSRIVLSADAATRCKAADEAATAERRAAKADRDMLLDLEDAVCSADAAIREHGYGDTSARANRLTHAQAKLAAWRETHADLWATIKAEREAARAQHEANIGHHVN